MLSGTTVVLKLGGHLLSEKSNSKYLKECIKVLKEILKSNRLIVITGGGALARAYIEAARAFGVDESTCDQLGIEASRLNAMLLTSLLDEDAYPNIPRNIDELKNAIRSGKTVITGGLFPAQSTDAVAAVAAELSHARLLIKATDVDGIYTSDPKSDPEAEKIEEIRAKELYRMIVDRGMEAGKYELFDQQALRIIMRSGIPTVVIDGRDPKNILKALKGEKIGTRITF